MSLTWRSDEAPPGANITVPGWGRVILRGTAIAAILGLGLALLLLLRLVERPVFGNARPWTARVAHFACWLLCRVLGLRVRMTGQPMTGPGAAVANHASWLDIFVLNAAMPVTFISKAEVAGWPGIGLIARAAGTRFIARHARAAGTQQAMLAETLRAGHRTVFFPEGTSTDGLRVLTFRSTLFSAFFMPDLRHDTRVQPVSIVYRAPPREDPRFYGWWGDMDFGAHALKVLAQAPQGSAILIFHEPLSPADYPDRKALAAACGTAVHAGFEGASGGSATATGSPRQPA